jgi:hypothetical protein
MEIITSNPIVFDGMKESPRDMFMGADGTLLVETTKNPIIYEDGMSNADGDKTKPKAKPSQPTLVQKTMDFFKELGKTKVGQFALQQAMDSYESKNNPNWTPPTRPADVSIDTPSDTVKPMSKGLKIGLIVGAVAIIGIVAYKTLGSKGAKAKASK